MLQDDDANSDSGLEPESPIARRKQFNISSVNIKHTGMCNVLYIIIGIMYVASLRTYVIIVSCSQTTVFHFYLWWWKKVW